MLQEAGEQLEAFMTEKNPHVPEANRPEEQEALKRKNDR